MFQLTKEEWKMFTKSSLLPPVGVADVDSFTGDYNLRSQIVTARFSDKWGGNRRFSRTTGETSCGQTPPPNRFHTNRRGGNIV